MQLAPLLKWSCVGALIALLAIPSRAQWAYPPTKRTDASDTYFGRRYPDPYRWLENLNAADSQAWFKAQSGLADGVIDRIPGRDALVREWTALDRLQHATYGAISYQNGHSQQ